MAEIAGGARRLLKGRTGWDNFLSTRPGQMKHRWGTISLMLKDWNFMPLPLAIMVAKLQLWVLMICVQLTISRLRLYLRLVMFIVPPTICSLVWLLVWNVAYLPIIIGVSKHSSMSRCFGHQLFSIATWQIFPSYHSPHFCWLEINYQQILILPIWPVITNQHFVASANPHFNLSRFLSCVELRSRATITMWIGEVIPLSVGRSTSGSYCYVPHSMFTYLFRPIKVHIISIISTELFLISLQLPWYPLSITLMHSATIVCT